MNEARPYLSPIRQIFTTSPEDPFYFRVMRLSPGHIIAKAHVNGHRVLTYSSDPQEALIECRTERWGLLLDNITFLPRFIPAQGKQGIWYHEL